MRLAEGTPSADGTQAFSRVGHSWGDLQPITAFGQPDSASCSGHQPAHTKHMSHPRWMSPLQQCGLHDLW